MELNQIIEENLLVVKNNKEREFEKSIKNLKKIQNFLNNHVLETKKEREYFAMKVFKELVIIESNGNYQRLLTEEESWRGLPTWLWSTVKEKVVRSIVNWVAPSKKDTWAANVIVTGLGNVNIEDIPKLGNCDYVTKQLAKAIVEGSLEHVKREHMGLTSGLSDVIRNALVETLQQNKFIETMEKKLVGQICPAVTNVGSKLKKAGI